MRIPRLPLALPQLCGLVATVSAAHIHDRSYADGAFGVSPVQTFFSTDLTPPALNLYRAPPARPRKRQSTELTFIGYRGRAAAQPGPMILDDWGELIWHGPKYGNVLSVERHRYLGQDVMGFFTGKEHSGFGNGQWNLLNSSYDLIATIVATNTSHGLDPHDLFITGDIATVEYWIPVRANLSMIGGPEDGWVHDCRVHSINITSGELLFEWSALEHVPVEETFYEMTEPRLAEGTGYSEESPFDYFHLNSLQRDELGNYVLGARGSSTVYYVDGETGDVLWRLGGRTPSFSMGTGVNFWFQHHARLHAVGPDSFRVSLFDNGANQYEARTHGSRGIVIEVNTTSMAASLVRQVLPPFHLALCASEGSVQTFEDGRILVGWGIRPYFSEFDSRDQIIRDAQFGTDESSVHSYRAFKSPWTAHPRTMPSFVMSNGSVPAAYVSWNGATEVSTWRVFGGSAPDLLSELSVTPRVGFETKLNVTVEVAFVAAAAFDAEGICLGVSEVLGYAGGMPTGLAGACPVVVVLEEPVKWHYLGAGVVLLSLGLALYVTRSRRRTSSVTSFLRSGGRCKI